MIGAWLNVVLDAAIVALGRLAQRFSSLWDKPRVQAWPDELSGFGRPAGNAASDGAESSSGAHGHQDGPQDQSHRTCKCGRQLNYFVTRDFEYEDWRHDDDKTRECESDPCGYCFGPPDRCTHGVREVDGQPVGEWIDPNLFLAQHDTYSAIQDDFTEKFGK